MNGLESSNWLTLGGLELTESAVLSACVSALLVLVSMFLRLKAKVEKTGLPAWLDASMDMMRNAVAEVVPSDKVDQVLPFIGSLWLFILVSNLVGLVPGLSSPTRDLSVTSALALVVFVAVHVYGIRNAGWSGYFRHYLSPSPILLPFHLISEITRTLALAIRLFGNMMSLEMAALLVLLVAGFLVPVPLLLLHVVEALVQAYIFGMLALIYVGSALEITAKHTSTDLPKVT